MPNYKLFKNIYLKEMRSVGHDFAKKKKPVFLIFIVFHTVKIAYICVFMNDI